MSGAGMSADAWAAAARREARGGLLRRVLRALGLDRRGARAEVVARRREAGAVGERMTAELLAPLEAEGWQVFADRALPGSRANADHVLVAPCGRLVVNVDSKLWSGRWPVHPGELGGGLWHGRVDRGRSLAAVRRESELIGRVVGRRVRVETVVAVHRAPVIDRGFVTGGGVWVMPAERLLPVLRSLTGRPNPTRAWALAQRAEVVLPRYGERGAS